ncbi:MAG: nuclear transport factor 2 family protein [Actinomadura sp.]
MEQWELVARERIRDTLAAYAHAGDRGRVAALADTFTRDGVLEVKGREPAVGRTAIIAVLSEAIAQGAALRSRGRPRYTRHLVTGLCFEELTPVAARTSAYFLVLTEHGADHWGRYRDELTPVGDRWLFTRRLVRVDPAEGVPQPAG